MWLTKHKKFQLELVNNNLDLCIFMETWIKEGDTITPTRLCPSGYKSLSISRHDKVGGGISIVYKSKFNISIARGQPFKTMESTCFSVNAGNWLISLITSYRPPDSNVLEFCNELTNLLKINIDSSGELILLGDFHIAVNRPFDVEPTTFLDILDSFNLVNKVDKPIHRLSNTLDLIIHDADSNNNTKNLRWTGSFLIIILFSLIFLHPALSPPQMYKYTGSSRTSTITPS